MKRFNNLLGIASGILIMLMSFLSTFEAIARSVFNYPTLWSLPISQYLLLGSAFLGGSYCLFSNGHVNVEVLLDRFRRKPRSVLIFIGYIVSIAYIFVLLYYTVQVTILAGRFGWDVVTTFPIPLVILYAVMIFGLVMLLLTFIYKLFEFKRGNS